MPEGRQIRRFKKEAKRKEKKNWSQA